MTWKVGDTVTCRRTIPAYYSGYGPQAVSNLTPGTPAIIAAIVPPVTGNRKYLVIVDYDDGATVRRAALHTDNIKKVTP